MAGSFMSHLLLPAPSIQTMHRKKNKRPSRKNIEVKTYESYDVAYNLASPVQLQNKVLLDRPLDTPDLPALFPADQPKQGVPCNVVEQNRMLVSVILNL